MTSLSYLPGGAATVAIAPTIAMIASTAIVVKPRQPHPADFRPPRADPRLGSPDHDGTSRPRPRRPPPRGSAKSDTGAHPTDQAAERGKARSLRRFVRIRGILPGRGATEGVQLHEEFAGDETRARLGTGLQLQARGRAHQLDRDVGIRHAQCAGPADGLLGQRQRRQELGGLRTRAAAAGAQFLITKPFTPEGLTSQVRSLLART